MIKIKHITSIIFIFWAGFVSSISFMEAWLKFQAGGVTREIGLNIGGLVFTALNRVEIVLLLSILILLILQKKNKLFMISPDNIYVLILTVIVLLQTLWLLPALGARAEIIISGNEPPDSMTHLWYVLMEFIKVTLLIMLSLRFLRVSK